MTPMQDLIERAIAARLWFRHSVHGEVEADFTPAEMRSKLTEGTKWYVLFDPMQYVRAEQANIDRESELYKNRLKLLEDNRDALLKRIEDGWK